MPPPPPLAAALALALTATLARAQPAPPDLHPLRPGDTSSPRDTLRDFIVNANEVAEIYRRDGGDAAIASPARARALDALDLSGAEYRSINTDLVAPYPIVVLLHEVLNRVDIPPDEQIPGDDDVARAPVERWRIPNTRITIARVTSGPRSGEYLFTAETVSQLEDYYARVAKLPPRPGATPGVYEQVLKDGRAGSTLGKAVQNRL